MKYVEVSKKAGLCSLMKMQGYALKGLRTPTPAQTHRNGQMAGAITGLILREDLIGRSALPSGATVLMEER